MRFVYSLLIRIYGLAILLAGLFNKKARFWRKGRENWRYEMGRRLAVPAKKTFWMHAASLGEFEQGRPLLEEYRSLHPDHRIVLTFFSPSGFEVKKDYPHADVVCYLPLDTLSNARDFVEVVSPDIAVFIKYEFWFNHLAVLKEQQVDTFLVSGRLHAKQSFFKPWGGWFRSGLSTFNHFFVINQESVTLLNDIGIDRVSLTGDTRFDRVHQIVSEAKEISAIEDFVSNRTCLILGSSWPEEESAVEKFIRNHSSLDFCLIVAPHEIDQKRIAELRKQLVWDSILYSEYQGGPTGSKVLFIDNIGLLSRIYRYADVAFIGGGYGSGVHNILEPAAWGLPTVIGPRYSTFPEVVSLVEQNGVFSVNGQEEVSARLLSLLSDDSARTKAGEIAAKFCRENAGATASVMKTINRL